MPTPRDRADDAIPPGWEHLLLTGCHVGADLDAFVMSRDVTHDDDPGILSKLRAWARWGPALLARYPRRSWIEEVIARLDDPSRELNPWPPTARCRVPAHRIEEIDNP